MERPADRLAASQLNTLGNPQRIAQPPYPTGSKQILRNPTKFWRCWISKQH